MNYQSIVLCASALMISTQSLHNIDCHHSALDPPLLNNRWWGATWTFWTIFSRCTSFWKVYHVYCFQWELSWGCYRKTCVCVWSVSLLQKLFDQLTPCSSYWRKECIILFGSFLSWEKVKVFPFKVSTGPWVGYMIVFNKRFQKAWH